MWPFIRDWAFSPPSKMLLGKETARAGSQKSPGASFIFHQAQERTSPSKWLSKGSGWRRKDVCFLVVPRKKSCLLNDQLQICLLKGSSGSEPPLFSVLTLVFFADHEPHFRLSFCLSLLEYKLYTCRVIGLFWLLLEPQFLEQCPAHSLYSIHICERKEGMKGGLH